MTSCCYPDEYAKFFTEREARRTARRFRRKGLRGSARELADGVAAAGIEGATVLEVGGGVGCIQAHLLRAGAARAVNVELSPNWEPAARALLLDLGLSERVDRRVGDFVDQADQLPAADAVVLHRVVCCYPDWRALLAAAASRTRNVLGITLPRERWWNRAFIASGNRFLALGKRRFRAFVHPVGPMVAAMESAGLRLVSDRERLVWRTLVFRR